MAVGGPVDLTETLRECHLRFGFQVQTAEHQHAVVLERVEHGRGDTVVGGQPFGIDADHLGTHRGGQFVDGQHAHRRVLSGSVQLKAWAPRCAP